MKKIFSASLLVVALTVSAYAGEMQFPVAPPPAPNGEVQTPAPEGDMQFPLLSILQSVLAAF